MHDDHEQFDGSAQMVQARLHKLLVKAHNKVATAAAARFLQGEIDAVEYERQIRDLYAAKLQRHEEIAAGDAGQVHAA